MLQNKLAPEKYVKSFRVLATVSWLGSGITAIILMFMEIIPKNLLIPIGVLVGGAIPVILFKLFSKVDCPRCGFKMKKSSGFPHTVYNCERCSHIVNTSIYSD